MNTLRTRIKAAADAFADAIATAIEIEARGGEWIDQNDSPLGKRRHLEAVRRGDLPASKDGKRVLVKKSDMDAYIRSKALVSSTDVTSEDEENEILRKAGLAPRRRSA